MDKIIKDKWVAALRSGDYKQGRMFLRQDDNYCCLGVLCDIQGAEWQNANVNIAGGETTYFLFEQNHITRRGGSPPEKFRGNLNIQILRKLSTMNDVKKASFTEIADYIEEKL